MWSFGKQSQLFLVCLSFSVSWQSPALAEDSKQIQWGDRSELLSVDRNPNTSHPNSLPIYRLEPLSAIDNNRELNFGLAQIDSLSQNPDGAINDDSQIQPSNNLETPDPATTQSENLPEDTIAEKTEKKWFFTIYGGSGTNSSLGETLTGQKSEFYDSFFNGENYLGLEVGRKIANIGKSFQIEVTGQARQHFNEASYLALETALLLRWHVARNSNFLNASVAVGDGLSYVTDLPQVESNRPSTFKKSNLLNYLLIETTFSLPRNPDWSLVLRLNHRSGVFGIFNGARDGSNNLSLGIRHSF